MDNSTVETNKIVTDKSPKSELGKERLYGEIIIKEARSLLGKYLPEALPQEPTEVLFSVFPQYLGKFRDVHYIAAEKYPVSTADMKRLDETIERNKLITKKFWVLEEKRTRLVEARLEKGESNFEDIDREIDNELLSITEDPVPERIAEDWEEPERLLQGPNQYSIDSWRGLYVLTHELIHQRQAELNPSAFAVLTSSELDNINPDAIDRSQLYDLLIESRKTHSRTQNKNSLFKPVVEGMATLGVFYVMGRFVEELETSGEKGAAKKVEEIRKTMIHEEIVGSKRKARAGKVDSYDLNYAEGIGIMRKLYKRFGLENIPKMLTSVDLKACQEITKGSHEYEQIMKNPTLLPGLEKAA